MAEAAKILDHQSATSQMSIGLKDAYRKEMASTLSGILASTYQLMIKSQVYHWNVTGPLFKPLHELTEEHYNALFEAVDIIAERVRALGYLAPVNFSTVKSFAPAGKDTDELSAHGMISDLIDAHEAAVRDMRKAAGTAGDADDIVTEDMLVARLTFHEKALWMLRGIVSE